MKKSVCLIGFMGSGKTTIGVKLSYRLKTPVDDTDKLIERKEKMSISDIFAIKGEPYFRNAETELLKQLAEDSHQHILSMGGGTPLKPENRLLMKQCGLVVYLRAKPETVYQRIKGDTKRPLLQCENPRQRIEQLMQEREEAYRDCADLIIDVDDLSINEIMDTICNALDA